MYGPSNEGSDNEEEEKVNDTNRTVSVEQVVLFLVENFDLTDYLKG